MDCKPIIEILNNTIFSEDKLMLLKRIINEPERFIGLFRPTKSYAKVIQFLLQSHEIKFGNAIQKVIYHIIQNCGYEAEMDKELKLNNELLVIDMIILKDPMSIIEMKIRDDHDSSKKRGQISNFKKKIKALIKHGLKTKVEVIFYFFDPTIRKNENYYRQELSKISNTLRINTYLFYGKELFEFLGKGALWDDLINCLKLWKSNIPDLPKINYDEDLDNTINILKNLSLTEWRKLIDNDELWEENGIISRLFRNGKSLWAICNIFENYNKDRLKEQYRKVAKRLKIRLEKLYKNE